MDGMDELLSNGGPVETPVDTPSDSVVDSSGDGMLMDDSAAPVMEAMPVMDETPAAPVVVMEAPEEAPMVNKLAEFEEKRAAELVVQQQAEQEKIKEVREEAVKWLEEQSDARTSMLDSRKSSNREREELEAHVPSSNAWEEVSTLVDLSVGAGEAEDNNRMREVILRMKHKVATA